MGAKTPPNPPPNLVDAGAVGVLPSTHSWTRTSTGCGPRPATSATSAPVAIARRGRGRGIPAANAASSRRTGPSNASTPRACGSRLNALTANRPRLVDSRQDRCAALGPLVMATSGAVGVPSPKASAIGDGESSIYPWLVAGFGCGHAGGKAERTHGARGLWSGRSVVSEGQVATRLSTGASDTGGSATARRVLPTLERALRVGHLEQGGGTVPAVS